MIAPLLILAALAVVATVGLVVVVRTRWLQSRTLEATVLGDSTQSYGKQVAVTVTPSGGTAFAMTGVVTSAKRTQPIGGAEAVSITIKPGIALDAGDQVTI